MNETIYMNRELSWLKFNERVALYHALRSESRGKRTFYLQYKKGRIDLERRVYTMKRSCRLVDDPRENM